MNEREIQTVMGATVYGSDGTKIGKVAQVYLDDVTDDPEWVTVSTGLFGGKESFVPVAGSHVTEEGLHTAYDKDTVTAAPGIEADGHITPDQEVDLYRHYGLRHETAQPSPAPGGGDSHSKGEREMTRSEEKLNVGTEKVSAGKARLRKYVVTEQQSVTVPVTREEVRLVREPITEANLPEGAHERAIGEEEHEVVLTEERVVVNKETVPVERVRMDVESVTEEKQVTEQVRKEKIEAEGDVNAESNR